MTFYYIINSISARILIEIVKKVLKIVKMFIALVLL